MPQLLANASSTPSQQLTRANLLTLKLTLIHALCIGSADALLTQCAPKEAG